MKNRKLRPSSFSAQKKTFSTAVAMCAIRSALRPFLTRPDVSFTALLETPEDIDSLFYHQAAGDLLGKDQLYDEFGNDLISIVRGDELAIVNALGKILDAKRCVILTENLEKLDADLRLVADIEVVLSRPSPAHLLSAARVIGLKGMTPQDAEYLADLEFRRVLLAVRGGRSLRSAISRLRRSELKAKSVADEETIRPTKPNKTLHNMAGYGEAASWGLQLAEDIAAWQAGLIDWEDVDRGAVLFGKSGCGKTTYGRVLAETCGIPIIEASSASWQAMGHLGDMLKAMRRTFEIANKKAPCILFIDEFDSFGDRSSNTAGDNLDYKRQVINGLLECLDPPGGRPGVVVVAATNFPNVIDPALLRPGRLERRLGIPLPDENARVAILRQHLRGLAPPADLLQFVELTAGYTGADIEVVAREARRRVRKERRPLTERDLLEGLPPSRALSDIELRRVAIHEAGHAIVSQVVTTIEVQWVVINRRVQLGDGGNSLGHLEYKLQESVLETEESLALRIDAHLAGIAAERVVFGKHSTSGGGAHASDLRIATDLATRVERHFGFGANLVLDLGSGAEALESLRMRDPRLWRAVDLRLRASLKRTEAILREYRAELEQLTGWLVDKGRVSGTEVRKLVSARRGHPGDTNPAIESQTESQVAESKREWLR